MTEIAVIVPTHNRADLLALTLRSILAQRDVDLSVSVVDDGSSDPRAVPDVVEALGDSRLGFIRHDLPRGVSAARNSGIDRTSSEWIAFCDDDDVWAPAKLASQIAVAGPTAGWVYTGTVAIDHRLRVLSGAPPLPPPQLLQALERYNTVPAGSSNVIVRRSVLERVGVFDPKLKSVGDWDLWIRLGRYGVPACVPHPYVGCRVHAVTITRNRRLMLTEAAIVAARHRVPIDRPRHFRWAAWNSMLEGRRFEAVGHYARAVAYGDLLSIGRAAVALVYPGVAQRRSEPVVDPWTAEAQRWLEALQFESRERLGNRRVQRR